MMGGALGGLEAAFLPFEGVGFWPLVSMGAILGGTMRSPFTGVVFALELTHDVNMLLPLLVAVTIAHGFTVLMLPRSILTEKVSRRGFHVSREYAVDPLEILFVREVMRTNTVAIAAGHAIRDAASGVARQPGASSAAPVSGRRRRSHARRRGHAEGSADDCRGGAASSVGAFVSSHTRTPTVAYPDEPLRVVVYRMAGTGLTRFPVVERGRHGRLLGMIGLT